MKTETEKEYNRTAKFATRLLWQQMRKDPPKNPNPQMEVYFNFKDVQKIVEDIISVSGGDRHK